MRRRRSPTRRLRQRSTQSARGGVRTCLASRVGACFGPRPAAPLADLANFEGSAHCSSSGASASVLVGQMASSVAVVSVISAKKSIIDWAARMAATRRLWCTIHTGCRAHVNLREASRTNQPSPRPRVIPTIVTGPWVTPTSSDQLVRSCCVADSWPLRATRPLPVGHGPGRPFSFRSHRN